MPFDSFSFYYNTTLSYGDRTRFQRLHPDDLGAMFKLLNAFKFYVTKRIGPVTLNVNVVFDTSFSIFKSFDMVEKFYDVLVELTSHYSDLPSDFKNEFPEAALIELRQKVFNLTLNCKL